MRSDPVRYSLVLAATILAACAAPAMTARLPVPTVTATAPLAATRSAKAQTATAQASPTHPRSVASTGTPSASSSPTPEPGQSITLTLLAEWGAGPINHLAWSPDGASLAVASLAHVYVYEAATLRQQYSVDANGPVSRVAYSPDGSALAAVGQGQVQFWDAHSGQQRSSIVVSDSAQDVINATALAFSPDSRLLALGSFSGKVQLFDVASGRDLYTFQEDSYLDSENVQSVAFSPEGATSRQTALTACGYGRSIVVSCCTGLSGPPPTFRCAAWRSAQTPA